MSSPQKNLQSRKVTQSPRIRESLADAYQAAFRPMILANYLERLRSGKTTREERDHLRAIMELVLRLHLPFPKAFHGDPVAIKRLGIAKAEASIYCLAPIMEAVRRRLKIPLPSEKHIPTWMIRSYSPGDSPKIQREKYHVR